MKRILMFFTLFVIITFVKAQDDFKLATELKDGTQWFIKEVGNYEAWVETVNKSKKVKSKKTGKIITTRGGKYIQYWICNCKEKKYSTESSTEYDNNGNPKGNLSDIYDERVLPNTVGEKILDIICGYDEYLEDVRQKEFDNLPINKELREGIDRYNNYIKGYTEGFKSVYCSPYSDCFVKIASPEEALYAEEPEYDYEKGFYDGKLKADEEKKTNK